MAADNPHFQYTGRVAKNGSQVLWEWPGVMVGARLNCPAGPVTIQVHIVPPSTRLPLYSVTELTKYIVFVDGTQVASFQTKAKITTYDVTLPTSSSGARLVEVFKNTERITVPMYWSFSEGGQATAFNGISVPASCTPLAPPPRSDRRIEFIGDSITCGFGNLARNNFDRLKCLPPPSGWLEYEDFSRATPSLVSAGFHAETHTECISQVGITRDGTTPARTTDFNMSHYLHRTLPSLGDSGLQWAYSSWTPDLAIVNLGTNDYDIAQHFHAQPSFADFEGNYTLLLNDYVSRYDGRLRAMLVLCGPMTKMQCPSVKRVATALNASFASLDVRYMEITLEHLNGCLFHPDTDGHRSIYEQLVPAISGMTGWEVPKTTVLV